MEKLVNTHAISSSYQPQSTPFRDQHKIHLYVLLVLFMFSQTACEWKPPRRPHKKVAINEPSTSNHSSKVTPNKRELTRPKKTTLKTTTKEKTTGKVTADKTSSKQTPSPTTNDPKSVKVVQKEVPKEILIENTQEPIPPKEKTELEKLEEQDYLMTIDPDGPPLIHIKELVVATKVRKRQPRGIKRIFQKQDKEVLAFLRVRNFEKEQKIKLKWIYQNEVVQQDRLKIGISPRWRTWSSLKFNKKRKRFGLWRIEVSAGNGKLLGSKQFLHKK